ncbi:hypothetical protein [Microbulbifer variabilis]|uniref:hypothetical protein n=1 Tax=Microbulbifer variabilis TaxID=266805 RepID=UPI000371CFDE|nr:hypothetical protein [Microbulbifer variabilis]
MDVNSKSGVQVYLDYLREHWALVASIGYLYLTSVGMVQSWTLFSRYDINIFEFAEINDFLLAAFRDPGILISGGLVFLWIGIAFVYFYSKNKFNFKGDVFFASKGMMINVLISAVTIPFIFSIWPDFFDRAGLHKSVTIELRRGRIPGINNLSGTEFKLIGTSENFIFVREESLEQSFIIPTSNLVAMVVKS